MATACLKAWKMHEHVVYKYNKHLKYTVFICKNENYPYKNFIIS